MAARRTVARRRPARRRNPADPSVAYRSILHSLDEIERSIARVVRSIFTLAAEGAAPQRSGAALVQKLQQLDSALKATRGAAESFGGELFE